MSISGRGSNQRFSPIVFEILDKNYGIKWVSGRQIYPDQYNLLEKIFPVADNFDPLKKFDFPSVLYIRAFEKNSKDILSWGDGAALAQRLLIEDIDKNSFLHVREFLKNPRILEQYFPHLKYKDAQ